MTSKLFSDSEWPIINVILTRKQDLIAYRIFKVIDELMKVWQATPFILPIYSISKTEGDSVFLIAVCFSARNQIFMPLICTCSNCIYIVDAQHIIYCIWYLRNFGAESNIRSAKVQISLEHFFFFSFDIEFELPF